VSIQSAGGEDPLVEGFHGVDHAIHGELLRGALESCLGESGA
jgi:hypothetical protein